jgi:tetratricopeptide (TPR) repeat protein
MLAASLAAGCGGPPEPAPVPVVQVGSMRPDCPAGTAWDGAQCARPGQDPCESGANDSDPDRECVRRRIKVAADKLPISILIRDTRRFRLHPRSSKLVIAEVKALEALLATTPSGPDRPLLQRRLGDAYVELSYATEDERGIENAAAAAATAKAIKMYNLVLDSGPQGKGLDEVLYSLALEYERTDNGDNARKAHLRLIQSWPSSPLIPLSYLAFGEYFFADGKGDPTKLPLAEQAFNEVIKYPPPANRAYGYAHYKLGEVFKQMGDHTRALSQFKKAIESASANPVPGAAQIAEQARTDLIASYSVVGMGSRAYSFFRPVSGDEPGKEDRTISMLVALSGEYGRAGNAPEAVAVLAFLLSLNPVGRFCPYKPQIMSALASLDTPTNAASQADFAKLAQSLAQSCP